MSKDTRTYVQLGFVFLAIIFILWAMKRKPAEAVAFRFIDEEGNEIPIERDIQKVVAFPGGF